MDDRVVRHAARVKVGLSLLALAFVFAVEVVGVIIVVALDISDESLLSTLIPECLGAAAAVACVMVLGARGWASVSRRDVRYTFTFGWWCLAVSVALMGIDLWQYLAEATPIASDWALRLGQTAILCLAIGIYEEFLFRGIVFHGLLATMGGTHRGVVRAVIITSLLFGAAHVDFETDFVDALSAIQALLKMVQTGIYSVLLCVCALRTHRLGGVSLYHGFDDFLLIYPSVALFSEPLSTEYVVQGDEAVSTILYYLVVIALYLPLLTKSLRELRRGQDVYRGAFMEQTMEQQALAAEQALAAQEAQALPQPWSMRAPVVPGEEAAASGWTTPPALPPVPDGLDTRDLRS